MGHITVRELALWQGGDMPFTLLDVRRAAARQGDGTHIAGDQWLDPALWLDWKDGISNEKPVVVYCAHGHEISQGLTATLLAMGSAVPGKPRTGGNLDCSWYATMASEKQVTMASITRSASSSV